MFVSYHFNGWARIWQGPFSPKEGLRLVHAGQGLVRVSLSGEARSVSGGHFPRRKASTSSKRAGAWFASPPAGGEARGVSGGHFPRRNASASSRRARAWFASPSAGKARGVSGGHFPRRKASASSRRARAWSRPCCHRARIFSTSRSVRWKPAVLSGAKSSTFPSRSSWNSRSRDWL